MSRECSCIKCHRQFSYRGIDTHYVYVHDGRKCFGPKDVKAHAIKFKEMSKNRDLELYGEFRDFSVTCDKCGDSFIVNERAKMHPRRKVYNCSRKCANKRTHSEETKNKIKTSLRKVNNSDAILHKNCEICNSIMIVKKPENSGIASRRKTCSHSCKLKMSNMNRKRIVDSSRMGGLRNGGGHSKMIKYVNSFGEEMMLNKEEICVAKALDSTELHWTRNTNGFPYITKENKCRKYYPDFYVTDVDVYVEYKGWVTDEMTHKMEDSVKRNGFKLLVIYGTNKRYKDLGLNIGTITGNPKTLIDELNKL